MIRFLLAVGLIVCLCCFIVITASAQGSSETTRTSTEGGNGTTTTTTVLGNNSAITLGLMFTLLGLAIALGRNWSRVESHIKDTSIHPTEVYLTEKYLSTKAHTVECARVQQIQAEQKAILSQLRDAVQQLNLFLARKFPDDSTAP
jgi:hypothetical protein